MTGSPWVTVVCAVVLMGTMAFIAWERTRSSGSPLLGGKANRPMAIPVVDGMLVVIRDGVAEAIGDWMPNAHGSEGDLWSEAAAGRATVARASYVRSLWRRGIYGTTERVEAREIVFRPELSGQDAALATAAVLELLDRGVEPSHVTAAAELREFRGERSEAAWTGYLINAVSGAALVLGILSGGWLLEMPGKVRAWVGRRRGAGGHCPRCGYSQSGLASHGIERCPECGRCASENPPLV